MTATEIAAAVAQMQARRPVARPDGVYPVRGGWSHSLDRATVWDDRGTCALDYEFALGWEQSALGKD